MPLTATAVKNARPKDKDYKLFDQGGLHLIVRKSGAKTWKYGYRLSGKQGTYTIGNYPETSLQEARAAHIEARKLVAQGQNPTDTKRIKEAKSSTQEKRFSSYCKEWIAKQNYAKTTLYDIEQRLEKNVYPSIDKRPVDSFSTLELLNILKPIANRGARETAKRIAGILRNVFNDLLLLEIVENNPAQELARLLPKPDHRQKTNFGHITSQEDLRNLLIQIYTPSNRQSPITTAALKLMPLLFLRPYNIRFMKWEYIDFDTAMLTIPASEMKANRELKVPLASQARDILKEVQNLHLKGPYVFVTSHGHGKPMSENTTTVALKRLINPNTNEPYGTGFMTSHGFRHTASTFLNEMGYSPDAIELQLGHVNKDRVRATYNKAQLIEERIQMMQEWADYLDTLRD